MRSFSSIHVDAQEPRSGGGRPPYELDHSLLTKAILNSGFDWEGEVLATYLIDSAIIARPPPDNPGAAKTSRVHTAAQTIDALRNAAPGRYIYQPTLIATDGFYERYGIDRDLVEFGECRPDLLMITAGEDGTKKVTVLDLKATDEEKLSHKIQATLYTLILEHVLIDHGIPDLTTTRQGGVWLYQHESPELFDLSSVTPPLETFLTNELQPILRAPASEAFWHLYYRCEWCDFYQHCRSKAEATNDVSLVPYLSTFAKRFLAKEAGVHTVGEFGKFLAREDAPEIMQNSASLRGKTRRMALAVDAITTGAEHMTGAVSVAMPTWEDVRIILTLQSEPLSGAIYTYAINRFGTGPPKTGSDPHVFAEWNATVCRVAPTEDDADKTALRRNLVGDLMAMLRPVHDFNAEHPSEEEWRIRKTVQVYVFDSYERKLLVEALLAATHDEDPAVAADAMSLFFHFQHPDLAAAEDHPAKEVFFPLVVLTSVVRGVFALPIKVVYRFADVVTALQPSTFQSDYTHNDYFDFELSNRLKSDAIFYVWFKGRSDLVPNIEGHLKRRVWATEKVVNGIRERLKPTGALFAYPPKFELPPGAGFRHPLLSRLAFVSRYEYVLDYLAQRARRSAPEPERLAAADSLKLTFIDGDRYRIDASQPEVEVDASGFYNWIFTHDDDGGRKARLSYDDAWYRDKPYAPGNQPIALAAVTHELRLGVIRLSLKGSKVFPLPKEGDVLVLEKRATDSTTDNLIGELAELDKLDDPWFSRLVADPVGTRRLIAGPSDVLATAKKLATEAGLTPSQLQAFESVVDHDIQLVWGPPGTGKTHFLAMAILCLAEAHRRHRLPMRVLITGFTNAAIDNALRKLIDLAEETEIFRGALPIRKIVMGESPVAVAVKPKLAAQFASDNPICVLGSTVWQARKTDPADLLYDLVVIDEGSQLEVAETAIPVRRLRPGGRLLIAGDDKQLPPIVKGNYPVPEGEPLLHRSILEALRERDPGDETVATLLENFRMCDVLCEYPASSIYPAAYGPATDDIANRRLSLKGALPDGFLGKVLDPAHPMVMCVMEEATGAAENLKEASLVAAVAVKLRELLPEGSDEEFWAHRLFIVSPHHAQIRAIKKELHRRREWDAEPFVDTVDKMQGQECDVVLVSYGVSDVEYALMEKEFIYSLNRLNVAITRARVKTVVFLSRSLLEPPLQALDRDDVAEGIAFMQGLAADPATLRISAL